MKNLKLKNWLFLILFVLVVGTLGACKSTSVLPTAKTEVNKTITVKEVLRDTVFTVQRDSSFYKAYLECRNNEVIYSQKSKVESQKGKYLQVPKVTIKNGVLEVDCYAEAQKLLAQWKDTYKTENTQSTKTIPVLVERQLTWWQTTQIWCGRLLLLLILLIVGASILRWRNII